MWKYQAEHQPTWSLLSNTQATLFHLQFCITFSAKLVFHFFTKTWHTFRHMQSFSTVDSLEKLKGERHGSPIVGNVESPYVCILGRRAFDKTDENDEADGKHACAILYSYALVRALNFSYAHMCYRSQ